MYKLIERDPWLLEFRCDWPEWFVGKYNWKNFTLIEISWEHDIILGGAEVTLALLGLRLRVHCTYDKDTPVNVEMRESMNEMMACKHDWLLEPGQPDAESMFDGPRWVCRECGCSTFIPKPEI